MSLRLPSSDVDFHKRANERDSLEGVTDPPQRETSGKCRDQLWFTILLGALVKVEDSFSKPYANDPERGGTCGGFT